MNHNFKDLSGQRFGQLEVIGYSHTNRRGKAMWRCKCDCGKESCVQSDKLISGRTTSCGHTRYGEKSGYHPARDNPRLYILWTQMKGRCYCKTRDNYKYYGGKGIKMCDEWLVFDNFYKWAMANGYDPEANHHECTIDRINPSKDYEPSNCRFVEWEIQANNRCDNHYIEYMGEKKTIAQWSRQFNIEQSTLGYRLRSGWSIERALNEPVHFGRRCSSL